jgi:hypothetical protein
MMDDDILAPPAHKHRPISAVSILPNVCQPGPAERSTPARREISDCRARRALRRRSRYVGARITCSELLFLLGFAGFSSCTTVNTIYPISHRNAKWTPIHMPFWENLLHISKYLHCTQNLFERCGCGIVCEIVKREWLSPPLRALWFGARHDVTQPTPPTFGGPTSLVEPMEIPPLSPLVNQPLKERP